MTARFRLPPVEFMALHLSALAHGGIGANRYYEKYDWRRGHAGAPVCYIGHLVDLGVVEDTGAINPYGIGEVDNDRALKCAVVEGERVPFERWCALVGVDVAEAQHGR